MRFTRIQAQFVAQRIRIEGSFNYAMCSYSSYPAITSDKFRILLDNYKHLQSRDNYLRLKMYILKTAKIKSFRDKAVEDNWKAFSVKLIRQEEARWENAFQEDMRNLFKLARSEI